MIDHSGVPTSAKLVGDTDFLDVDSSMAERIRAKDWAATPLGPIAGWPQSLRTAISLCLASSVPISIIWGPASTQIYNDGFRVVCGEPHPAMLGSDFRVSCERAWQALDAPFAAAWRGQTASLENQRIFSFRNGFLEEAYFTFSFSPIRDESGAIGGLFHPVTETTTAIVGERRTRAVRDLTAGLALAQTCAEVRACTIATLAAFPLDLPFVLVYERDPIDDCLRRMGHTGIDLPTALAPDVLDEALWPVAHMGPAFVERTGLRRLVGAAPCGPYPEAPEVGFAMPVYHTGPCIPTAVLVTAASARLPLDDAMRGFVELVGAAYGAALGRTLRLEQERDRLAGLAALDRAKTLFYSNVSHEFRTPLTLMLGPLDEVIERGALAERDQESVGIAQRNAQRLLKLVNGLLDFTSMEEGRAAARFAPTDLARLTADLASHFRTVCERGGLALDVRCVALDEPVWVDRDSWEKIVLNLLSNAFKFTLHGAIRVRMAQVAGMVELAIADSGIGIAPEHIERVFERFHRIDGQRGRSIEGTGIGLALVKEMVALHGGSVTVDSREGIGTTFHVRLPFGHAHLPPGQLASTPLLAQPNAVQPVIDEALRWTSGGDNMAPVAATGNSCGRIVLAEDNADMRAYITRVLVEAGYAVQAFADGAAALAALDAAALPDLLLSNVTMPALDGFALLAAVRAEPATCELVVIMLSARAGQEARVHGLAEGADDYLVKPFSARELVARVDGAIRLARLRKDAAVREHALRLLLATRDSNDALARSQAQVTSLFAQTATGVLQATLDGRLRKLNPRMYAMLGLPGDEAGDRSLLALVHPDERAGVAALLATLGADGQPAQRDVRWLRADGATAWTTVAFTPVVASDTLLAVVLDIGHRVEAEQQLRLADRNKDDFLAMLAHELRNPLAPISAAAELMNRVQLDATRLKQTSAVIARQVAHMTELVDDLLDVSRVTRGLVVVDQTVQDMKAVVAHAVEQVRPLIDAHGHALTIRLAPARADVLGDHKRLVQLVSNLLHNAAKYTPPCGRIELELALDAQAITVSVSDNGLGIARDLQPRVFDLFTQAERTPDRALGGLGLGLALARSLVEVHGGSIACASDGPGCGSRFTVTLPRHAGPAALADAGTAVRPGALQVLVVDDNVDAASTIALLIESFGYQAHVEHDAQSALVRALAVRPHVCILDIGLPGMDGNELARCLRADGRTAATVLIALTGYSQQKDRERSRAAGFDHHFAKPANIDQLTAVLAEVAPR